MTAERLQKIIARAGLASRRKAEVMITDGDVMVNGEVVRELGARADPATDRIELRGLGVLEPENLVYILLNKPSGTVTTNDDPEGRTTVLDHIEHTNGLGKGPDILPRIFPVGRLDYGTEGVLVLTNDGELAHRLTHPSFGVDKTYEVKVKGVPPEEALQRLREGVRMPDGMGRLERPTAPAQVTVMKHLKMNTWLRIVIHEGRHHQVRRMCQWIGHQVIKLVRTRYGSVDLTGLPLGRWRFLQHHEVEALRESAAENTPEAKGRRAKAAARKRTASGGKAAAAHKKATRRAAATEGRRGAARGTAPRRGAADDDRRGGTGAGRGKTTRRGESGDGRRGGAGAGRGETGDGRRGGAGAERGETGDGRRGGAGAGRGKTTRRGESDGGRRSGTSAGRGKTTRRGETGDGRRGGAGAERGETGDGRRGGAGAGRGKTTRRSESGDGRRGGTGAGRGKTTKRGESDSGRRGGGKSRGGQRRRP